VRPEPEADREQVADQHQAALEQLGGVLRQRAAVKLQTMEEALMGHANRRRAEEHRLNENHPLVKSCKLGVTLTMPSGENCVYPDLYGCSKTHPVRYIMRGGMQYFKASASYFEYVRTAWAA